MSYRPGNVFFHQSLASALVILNVSPQYVPEGNKAFSSDNMCEKTNDNLVKFRRQLEFSSNILSLPSLNSLMAFLHLAIKFSMKILKYSQSLRKLRLSSYLLYINFRCWYVSGNISRMNGGLFFKFIFGCWHCFTTLSICRQDFSISFLSTIILCAPPCCIDFISPPRLNLLLAAAIADFTEFLLVIKFQWYVHQHTCQNTLHNHIKL